MMVQSVQQQNQEKYSFAKSLVTGSVAGGLITAGIERALLPAEVKAAIKSTRFGQDVYMAKSKKYAQEALAHIKKSNANSQYKVKNMPALKMEEIMSNAKNLYPELKTTAKSANKMFLKTFATTAAILGAAKILSFAIIKHRQSKEQ